MGKLCTFCTVRWCYCSPDHITEDEARSALRTFVAENCCYGKAAVNGMTIDKIAASNAYHVRINHAELRLFFVYSERNCAEKCNK